MKTTMTRRELLSALGVIGLGGVAAACTHATSTGRSAPAGSIASLKASASPISMIGPPTDVNPGPQPYNFFLVSGQNIIPDAPVRVWVAESEHTKAAGPFTATW